MKGLFYFRLLSKLILILALFLLFSNGSLTTLTSSALGSSPDAIAFRVMPNPDNLSPRRWYQENIQLKGSPQDLMVDGYEAVRDGRTVYVDAANVDLNNKRCTNSSVSCRSDSDCASPSPAGVCSPVLYTNIYIISYNQNAEDQTVDIFGRMLENWKFNTNISEDGASDRCSATDRICLSNSECPRNEHCQSKKARVIRDTRRLADLADIKLALEKYQAGHNGAYPALQAGSYLAGKSISKWPSWRATLGSALGSSLPVDPINKLGGCRAACCLTNNCNDIDRASCGYNQDTCWNQAEKKFADPTPPPVNNEFNLPDGSHAYVYAIKPDGSYNLCAIMESGLLTTLAQGACPGSAAGFNTPGPAFTPVVNCGDLRGYAGQPFSGFVSAIYSGNDTLRWEIVSGPKDSTGNNWNGTAMTSRNALVVKQRELRADRAGSRGDYQVEIRVTNSLNATNSNTCPIKIGGCGDGLVNGAEQCDGTDGVGAHQRCDSCVLTNLTYCGDNRVQKPNQVRSGGPRNNGMEQCDGTVGLPPNKACSSRCALVDLTYCGDGVKQTPNQVRRGGPRNNGLEQCDGTDGVPLNQHKACSSDCTLIDVPYCGDGNEDAGEDCDWGGRNTNTPATPPYSLAGTTLFYCDLSCHEKTVIVPHCGDGIVNGREQCDDGNWTLRDGCNTYISNDPDSPPNCQYVCGDRHLDPGEQCDVTVGEHQRCDNCILTNKTYCGDGEVQNSNDDGVAEVCDNGATSVTRARSSSGFADLSANCRNILTLGTETCNENCDGWNPWTANQPIEIGGTTTACDSSNKELTDYACCEVTACTQDGCACCGMSLGAATPRGYTSTSTFASVWDNLQALNSGRTETACGQRGDPHNVPNSACRLSISNSNSRHWYVTTFHSTAKYRCWK